MIPIGRCDICQVPMYQGRTHVCGPNVPDALVQAELVVLGLRHGLHKPVRVAWHPDLGGWTSVHVQSPDQVRRWAIALDVPTKVTDTWHCSEDSTRTWVVTRYTAVELTAWAHPGHLRVSHTETRYALPGGPQLAPGWNERW